MIIITTLGCLVIIAFLVKFIYEKKHKRFYDLLKQFPSHPSYPFIGNIPMLYGNIDNGLEKLSKLLQPYDSQVYWLGPMPCIFMKKYDQIATVLNQCHYRDAIGILNAYFGISMVSAGYKDWRTSRRIVNPAFSSQMHLKYLEVFKKNASNLIKNLESVADTGKEVDVLNWMTQTTLESIIENALGITDHHSDQSEDNFCDALHKVTEIARDRVAFPWLLQPRIFNLYLKITGKIKDVESFQYLPAKILKNKLNESRDEFDDEANSSRAIVDLLIKNFSKDADLTETRMRDELLSLMGAGSETTAMSLSFLLLMLAMHQDIQDKVYEEIKQLSTADGMPNDDDLINKLPYLDQCINETVRRFSPIALTSRRTHKEVLLPDNKIIPANVLVVTFLYFADQDPALFKNPSKWDPEHFNEQAVEQRPKTSPLGFSYGARNCIGTKYALMAIKTISANIIRKYHLSTSIKELTEKDLCMDLSIRSKLGYPVKFTSRPEGKA